MAGLVLLVALHIAFNTFTVVMYIVPIYLMVSGAAMAALVSCFAPIPDSEHHETRQLMSLETGSCAGSSSRSSSPIGATTE